MYGLVWIPLESSRRHLWSSWNADMIKAENGKHSASLWRFFFVWGCSAEISCLLFDCKLSFCFFRRMKFVTIFVLLMTTTLILAGTVQLYNLFSLCHCLSSSLFSCSPVWHNLNLSYSGCQCVLRGYCPRIARPNSFGPHWYDLWSKRNVANGQVGGQDSLLAAQWGQVHAKSQTPRLTREQRSTIFCWKWTIYDSFFHGFSGHNLNINKGIRVIK